MARRQPRVVGASSASTAHGLAARFTPTVIGFGAVLDNLSRFFDNGSVPGPVFWIAAAYLLVWAIPRRRHPRSIRAQPRRHAPRVLRGVRRVLRAVHPPRRRRPGWSTRSSSATSTNGSSADLYERLTRDMTVERTAFFLNLALYLLFGLAVMAFCNVVIDYAKIRAVVEDRRSMLGAIVASVAVHRATPGRRLGLVCARRAVLRAGRRHLRARRSGRRGHQRAWRVRGRADLPAGAAVREAAVLRVTDGAVPESLAHTAYTASPAAGVARVALGREHRQRRETAVMARGTPQRDLSGRFGGSGIVESWQLCLNAWPAGCASRYRAPERAGLVVGLSGGIDSAVVARVSQMAMADAVLAVILPAHSDPQDERDARLVAERFALQTSRQSTCRTSTTR